MKFNQYIWDLYKNSPQGQSAISEFTDREDYMNDVRLLERYNPKIKDQFNTNAICNVLESVWCYKVSEYETPETLEDAAALYEELVCTGWMEENAVVIKPGNYNEMLELVQFLSINLSYLCPDFFFPYLYIREFYRLQRLSDFYEIVLPPIPKKPDYKGRCMYYWELCKVFYQFRIDNGLTPQELWAFMYDHAPQRLNKTEDSEMPQPSSAWFIGGLIKGYGEEWTTGFWQSNIETKRGDILIHYETSPVSAITCMWIAQTDGVTDPFFHYYSNTYIGDRIDIPHITLKELQSDEYFSTHPLVKKNFQGVNGWSLSGEDYSELLRIVKSKGFDTSLLPKIYAPSIPKGIEIGREHDVEEKLLEPLLNSMGWHKGKDFIRQLGIHAGRGHRIYPDYALHYDNKPNEEKAKVLIEAKLQMKSNKDVEQAFLQARSYAQLLSSSVIVLCDKYCLIVYEKKDGFDRTRNKRYYWEQLENSDTFNELKNKLNI